MIARIWRGWAPQERADNYQRHYETEVSEHLRAVTGTGVAQARHMTRIRRGALASPGNPVLARQVRLGVVRAAVLRSAIAVLTMALLAIGVLLATQNR